MIYVLKMNDEEMNLNQFLILQEIISSSPTNEGKSDEKW